MKNSTGNVEKGWSSKEQEKGNGTFTEKILEKTPCQSLKTSKREQE